MSTEEGSSHREWPDAPDRIWLNVCDEAGCGESFREHESTWCEDKVHDSDIEYVRATPAPEAPQDRIDAERLRSALERLRDSYRLLAAGKPVRDMAETLAEVDRALSHPSAPSSEQAATLAAAQIETAQPARKAKQ